MLEGAEAAARSSRIDASHARYPAHPCVAFFWSRSPSALSPSRPPQWQNNRWIEQKAPLNIAHQGGEDEFPSNTMYAFRKAVRAAHMLELDVGVSDGKVIVMHDTTVDGRRTATGRWRRRR